jgi:hypothetical protein
MRLLIVFVFVTWVYDDINVLSLAAMRALALRGVDMTTGLNLPSSIPPAFVSILIWACESALSEALYVSLASPDGGD